MKLLTKKNRMSLPPLYSQQDKGDEAIVYMKFFAPDSSWTWYVLEFDGEDTFFGLVDGFELEYGYFSLSEISTTRGPLGLHIERDMYWDPKTVGEIKAKVR